MRLTEYDSSRHAVIDPEMVFSAMEDFPETVVSIFSHQLFGAV